MSFMPRPAKILLPILRAGNYATPPAKIGTWVENIDIRQMPQINIRRISGRRNPKRPLTMNNPIIEMTAYGTVDLPTTEQMYEDALEALYIAWLRQTQTAAGYIHSIREDVGATDLPSPFADSWRIQGLIQVGLRPARIPPS